MMFGDHPSFVSLVDHGLSDFFLLTDSNDYKNLHFNAFDILNDQYNYELDANIFYIHTRHLDVPHSDYVFLDSFTLCSYNSTTTLVGIDRL